MKRLAAFFLLLSLCTLAHAQTRPRRVGSDNTAPAAAQQTRADDGRQDTPAQSARRTQGDAGSVARADLPSRADAPVEVDDDEVINVNTTLVTIPVSVADRGGRYVPDLRKEDFRVYEDGVEQPVAYFAAVEKPFTVALLIDTSGSTRYRIEEMQDAAISFVDQLRPDDRVLVVSFDDEVRVLSEATSDRNALRAAIRSARRGEGTRLYDAVDFVIRERFRNVEGRKAVVLFTDGVDTTSRRANYQSTLRDAEMSESLIYSVQYDTWSTQSGANQGGYPNGGGYPRGGGYPGGGGGRRGGGSRRDRDGTDTIIDILGGIFGGGGGRNGGGGRGGGGYPGGGGGGYPGGGGGGTGCTGCTREEYERGDQYLGDLANVSGARRYRADDYHDLSSTFALVAEELRRQYSLGYYPQRTPAAGERRRIEVRVNNRPELAVQARDTYVFGAPGANGGGNGQQQQPTNGTQRRTRPNAGSQPLVTDAPWLER